MIDEAAVTSAASGVELHHASGLTARVLAHDAVQRLEAFGLSLLLHPATVAEAGLANVHLRLHGPDGIRRLALLGPTSGATVSLGADEVVARGSHGPVRFRLRLRLGREHPSWHWLLEVHNGSDAPVAVDAVLTHDPALAPLGAVRTNEFYVSQYLDLSPVRTAGHGTAVAVRQNMPGPTAPWLMVGTYGTGTGWSTDAAQLARRTRSGVQWPGLDRPELPSAGLQHEHSLIALQDAPVTLAPGARHRTGFWGIVVADHPEATSDDDARWAELAVADGPADDEVDHDGSDATHEGDGPDASGGDTRAGTGDGAGKRAGRAVAATLWSAPALDTRPLTVAELDAAGLWARREHVERDLGAAVASGPDASDDRRGQHDDDNNDHNDHNDDDIAGGDTDGENCGGDLAWMTDGGQLVTAAKDLAVLRPHGHLLRTGDGLTPDTATLTTTVWMAGTFHSQVTRGHAGRHPVLTGRRTYLGLLRAHGLRLFVESATTGPDDRLGEPLDEAGWRLLELPSAWYTGLDRCRWFYATDDALLQVTATAGATDAHLGLSVEWLSGAPRRVLAALQVADDLTAAPRIDVDPSGHGVTLQVADTPASWRLSWSDADGAAEPGDGRLQADGRTRGLGWLTVLFEPSPALDLRLAPAGDGRVGCDDTQAADRHPAAGSEGSTDTLRNGDEAVDADGADVRVDPALRLGDRFWERTAHAVHLSAPADDGRERGVDGVDAQVANLSAALPWFAHNALVHYLSPRGLEQFSGGAWGTRDVCQGPVGLLTAIGRQDAVRDVLLRVFRAQNARGDWPQAFEFLPPLPEAGQHDSHGDVVFWPVLAAGDYLRATGDGTLLDETVPFVGDDGLTEPATVLEHLCRAVDRIAGAAVPGSPLPAYGHGDWNDSLQPADPRLAANLVSTWTAVLQAQALGTLADGLTAAVDHDAAAKGDEGAAKGATELAVAARALSGFTHEALRDQLAADPVLPGYLLHHPADLWQTDAPVTDADTSGPVGERPSGGPGCGEGDVELLVHPSDERTGLHYGVLPWIHAIGADLLTPEQARHHLDLIEAHLLGPDGVRLFDRPVGYVGGPMSVFQRAEASTFWGREIGLMYVHAHLRYAEALARVGDGAGLLAALAKASPVGLGGLVPQARPRQTTCYYSSSDGVFADRYDASERYAALMAGEVPLEGGWRIYSSGPGLVLRLVTEVLLGFRQRAHEVEIDPVLPPRGGELTARLPLAGANLSVRYVIGPEGHGVRRVTVSPGVSTETAAPVGGRDLELRPLPNPYRRAGVAVRLTDLLATTASASASPALGGIRAGTEHPSQPTTEIVVETY